MCRALSLAPVRLLLGRRRVAPPPPGAFRGGGLTRVAAAARRTPFLRSGSGGAGACYERAHDGRRTVSTATRATGNDGDGGGETAAGACAGGLTAAREAQSVRLHRFYTDEPISASGGVLFLGREESRHATRALRLKPGSVVEVCDGRGAVMTGELVEWPAGASEAVGVAPIGEVARAPFAGPRWEVAVACGGLKGGRADWLVEKCAELGASALLPLLTERSANVGSSAAGKKGKAGKKRDKSRGRNGKGNGEGEGEDGGGWGWMSDGADGDKRGREGRWERVAMAASKQCLRTHALRIMQPIPFDALVERVATAPVALLAAAGAPPLQEVLQQHGAGESPSTGDKTEDTYFSGGGILIVGPEGDFTDQEVAALVSAGAKPVGLGPLRLRVETAAVGIMACISIMHPHRNPPGC